MTRRLLAAAVCLVALAVPAQAGAVEDIKPTASISIKMGGKAKECVGNRCGNLGGRTATVTWATNCNASHPDLSHSTDVSLMARPRKAGGKPVGYTEVSVGEGGENATGSNVVVVPAGVRLYAEVEVSCSYAVLNEDGSSEPHTGRMTAITPDVFLKPALFGHNFPRNSFCGVNVPGRQSGNWAQAGQYATLHYLLRFSPFSLLTKGGVAGEAAGIRLYGRGAGLNFKVKPVRSALRRGEYETYIRPRRGGTLKIWATIGGVKTTVRAIRVLPKRC